MLDARWRLLFTFSKFYFSPINSLLFCETINNYSFKMFPRFWSVETMCIIHHNKLLVTKFGKNFIILNHWHQTFCHIEPWRQNEVKSSAHCTLIDYWPRKPGDMVVLFLVSRKTKWNGETPLRAGKYFEWIFSEFGFCRIWRILQIFEGVIHRGWRLDLQNSLYPQKLNSIIANYRLLTLSSIQYFTYISCWIYSSLQHIVWNP